VVVEEQRSKIVIEAQGLYNNEGLKFRINALKEKFEVVDEPVLL
jgi:hypothetical protein